MNLNIKRETIKLLGENTGGKLLDISNDTKSRSDKTKNQQQHEEHQKASTQQRKQSAR